jgi:hypothetical protein
MKKVVASLLLVTILSGCGARVALQPKTGNTLPVKPLAATSVPTPGQLMTADTQARPKRSDEQINKSEERQDDKFDLPPKG